MEQCMRWWRSQTVSSCLQALVVFECSLATPPHVDIHLKDAHVPCAAAAIIEWALVDSHDQAASALQEEQVHCTFHESLNSLRLTMVSSCFTHGDRHISQAESWHPSYVHTSSCKSGCIQYCRVHVLYITMTACICACLYMFYLLYMLVCQCLQRKHQDSTGQYTYINMSAYKGWK